MSRAVAVSGKTIQKDNTNDKSEKATVTDSFPNRREKRRPSVFPVYDENLFNI